MNITRKQLEQLTIRSKGLDPIRVVVEEFGSCQGAITITCYGRAWTAYWGAMGSDSVEEFFRSCDTHYLVNCLVRGMTPGLRRYKADDEYYLGRIVDAVRAAFEGQRTEVQS